MCIRDSASGAWLVLDGDSNGDGAGSDYAYIEHNSSGHLNLINPVGGIALKGGGVNSVVCQEDAEVVIYHNGSRKIETLTTGAKITGNLELSSTYPSLTWTDTNHNSDFRITNDDGKLIVYDITRSAHVMDFLANGDVRIRNDKGLYFGEGNDLLIGHDGTSTRIEDSYGYLGIKSNALELRSYTDSELYAKFTRNGAAELYHDNVKTAFTGQDALYVYGRTSNSGMIEIASNQGANNNDRFRIHKTSAAARLTIQEYSSGSWVENIRITGGGAVELKHSNGTTKFQTTSTGAQVTTASSANSVKNITTSTSTPSGGSDGDLWFTYVA